MKQKEPLDTGTLSGSDASGGLTQICTTGVDLGGLMTVLGRHLYSTPVVALRELVQNAHDSIIRRRLEDKVSHKAAFSAESPQKTRATVTRVNFSRTAEPHAQSASATPSVVDIYEPASDRAETGWQGASRITVTGDPSKGIIRVTDTGAGLTEEEIHTYLATVGVGYTRTLREKNDETGLIGMFGLGFLSAFVLATEVTVTTTSYQQPDKGWRYQSSTGERYSLTPVPPRPVGTEVSLVLRDDFAHLAGEDLLREILSRYCILLREPVFIGAETTPLNPERPPWHTPEGNTLEHPTWLQRKRLEFARRFSDHFEPLCTLPVVPPFPRASGDSDAKGLLWVQDGATYGTSDNRQVFVFGRGMLLDDDSRDLLPPWAGFVSGVIESNLLTPTASREDLQRDDQYYATRQALAEALVTGLSKVAQTQPESWRRILARHNEALLGAALCDDRLFDLLADSVRVPTSQGDMPARSLKTEQGAIHVMLGAQGGFEDMLFRVLRTPVARGDRYAVLPFLRKWVQAKGGTLVELGTEQGNKRLFTPERLPEPEEEWLGQTLGRTNGTAPRQDGAELVVPARFAPKELPLVVVPDRETELKRRLEEDEVDKRISVAALRLARNFTASIDGSVASRLYVNLDNPAVEALLTAYRSGNDWQTCALLLRSLKIILSANDEAQGGLDVNTALGDFCTVAAGLAKR